MENYSSLTWPKPVTLSIRYNLYIRIVRSTKLNQEEDGRMLKHH